MNPQGSTHVYHTPAGMEQLVLNRGSAAQKHETEQDAHWDNWWDETLKQWFVDDDTFQRAAVGIVAGAHGGHTGVGDLAVSKAHQVEKHFEPRGREARRLEKEGEKSYAKWKTETAKKWFVDDNTLHQVA